jgi:uncharacterized protein HemY
MTLPSTAKISTSPPSAASVAHDERTRAAELRGEAQLTSDRTQKAALLYEAGCLTEAVLHQPAHAVQDYLSAYNSDNRSRLPLLALLRMFERRSSYKNLARLYDAELRGARSVHEKVIALVDQACLDLIHEGDSQAATARLWRALENDVTGEAALLLEWNRRAASDSEGALKALLSRSESCDDPTHRGVLLLEIAALREQAGETRSALEALRSAASGKPAQEIFLVALMRFARQHGFIEELVEASEQRAELIANELSERLVDPEPDQTLIELLRSRAVALWYEAARLRCTHLGDPKGAVDCLSKALATRPDDLLLRKTRMLAYDLLEDRASAAEEAKALLARGAEGEDAATLHFRLAEHALVAGDTARARESLMEAIASASGSIAADAILDDLLLDEQRHLDRIERRESRASGADGERAGRWLLEAAQIAAHELGDAARARTLFERSAAKQPGQVETARAAYGAALLTRDPALTSFALERMLALELEEQERAALLLHAVDVAESEAQGRELLAAALEVPREEREPLAHVARQRAAETKDFALLARAHESLAALSRRDDEAVAHLCCAARAAVRAADLPRAREQLERALSRDPAHSYAIMLFEELLRRQGQGQELIELLRRAADSQQSGESAETALISAGLVAEKAGDPARARKLYEDAADKRPEAISPLWCLMRLAQRSGDDALARDAQRRLGELESARSEAGVESLLASELLDLSGDPDANVAQQLAELLDNPKVARHAALVLTVVGGIPSELRARALDVLESQSEASQKGFIKREQLSVALAAAEPQARIFDLSEEVLRLLPKDLWASFTKSCVPLPHDEEGHANALLKLGELTSDARLRHALAAEACWTERLYRSGAVNTAEQRAASDPGFARVLLETAAPGRDDALRIVALATLERTAQGAERSELLLARGRAQLAQGDAEAALSCVATLLAADPDDTCALELKRIAARAAGDFRAVIDAAEALARQIDGDFALSLLEESAMVRIDELNDAAGAEQVLTLVLSRAPTRPVAYARLHDLLRQKSDSAELIALVSARTEHIHDAEELAKLFYELARLYRARGELDQALDAIDNVLMLEEHVGALALSAEIHTSRQEWSEAVGALESMATAAGVPKAQRRLARLGAADFLEHRLARPGDALLQLEKLRDEGHDDLALHLRIADVAERAHDAERATAALKVAAAKAPHGEKIRLLMRRARLSRDSLGRSDLAIAAFREVLEHEPGERVAARELWALTNDRQAIAGFENEVRKNLQLAPLEPQGLRDLRLWASLVGDQDAAFVALLALTVLAQADDEERRLCDAAIRRAFPARLTAGTVLTTRDLTPLLTPALEPRYEVLLRSVFSAAGEIDQLEPSKFGVGRGQRISAREPSPLRDEVTAMCAVLGIPLNELYVGGNDLLRVAALPEEDGVSLVLGMGVTAPMGPTRRHQLALQLAACRLQSVPLLSRSNRQAARLAWAALRAAEWPLPEALADEDLGELPRSMSRALPRKLKKALPELARALPDRAVDMPRQCALLLAHTRRLALLVAGDLQAGLDEAVGALPTREAIAGSEAAIDLIRTWTSGPMALLRKKLGLSQ